MARRRFYSSALRSTQTAIEPASNTTMAILASAKIQPMGVFPSEPPAFLLGMLGPDPAIETFNTMQQYSKKFRMEPLGAFAMPIIIAAIES